MMPTFALTFLDPLTGLVAAGVSVPALLLLYFLKLRRRPVRVTASFLWQQAAEDLQVNTPFRWLRVSLVLLLQLLGLLLLCAAIARPAMRDVPPASGRVIVLLDASASMRATDGPSGRTRFEEAKRAATEFVRSLDLGGRGEDRAEAMVIAFANEPRVLANITGNHAELLGAIERAEPTDQPGDLAAALALVDAFGGQSGAGEDDDGLPVLVVFTDGGHATPGAPLTVAAREVRFVRAGPPAETPKANLGVSAFSARRDEADPTIVRLFARLVNASPEPAVAAPVIEVNGLPVRAERVEAPGASEMKPGEASLTVETRAASRAVVTIRLPAPDTLASDNAAALVVDPPRGMDVVIVAPPGSQGGRAAPDVFLREAIDALRPRSVRAMTLAEHDASLRSRERAPGSLLAADLVIYDRVMPTELPPIPSLSFGAGLPIRGLSVAPPPEPHPTRFLSWRRTDPLLRAVSLGETLVARALDVSLPDVGAAGVSRVEPLAFGDRGPLVVSLIVAGVQRVVVAFELSQSTWPLDVGFAVFLANAAETLAPRAATASGRSTDTRTAMVVHPAPDADRVVAQGPQTLEARVAPASGRADPVSLGTPTLAGVYSVSGVVEEDSVVAVNLSDPTESAIATRDTLGIVTRGGDTAEADAAAPRELWPWFVLAAAGPLVLEWLLFAWRMRV